MATMTIPHCVQSEDDAECPDAAPLRALVRGSKQQKGPYVMNI